MPSFVLVEGASPEAKSKHLRKNATGMFTHIKSVGNFTVQTALHSNSWPFEVVNQDNKPYYKVNYLNEERLFSAQDLSAMVLRKLKEDAEEAPKEAVQETPEPQPLAVTPQPEMAPQPEEEKYHIPLDETSCSLQ